MITVRKVGIDARVHFVLLDPAALLNPSLPSLAVDFNFDDGLIDYSDRNIYKGRSSFSMRRLGFKPATDLDNLVSGMERVAKINKWKVDHRGILPLT